MTLRRTAAAEQDIFECARGSSAFTGGVGGFLAAYDTIETSITTMPRSFPYYEDRSPAPGEPELRAAYLRRYRCLVVYRVDGDAVLVVAVGHIHRGGGFWDRRAT